MKRPPGQIAEKDPICFFLLQVPEQAPFQEFEERPCNWNFRKPWSNLFSHSGSPSGCRQPRPCPAVVGEGPSLAGGGLSRWKAESELRGRATERTLRRPLCQRPGSALRQVEGFYRPRSSSFARATAATSSLTSISRRPPIRSDGRMPRRSQPRSVSGETPSRRAATSTPTS